MTDASLSTNVIVEATGTGWRVTDSKGQVFNITDANNNGIFDKDETIQAVQSENSNQTGIISMSNADIFETRIAISYLDGLTTQETILYNQYNTDKKALEEAKIAAAEAETVAQTTSNTPTTTTRGKKKNFWEKLVAWTPAITGFVGLLGCMSPLWRFNSGNANDAMGKSYALTQGIATATTGLFSTMSLLNMDNTAYSSTYNPYSLTMPTLDLSNLSLNSTPSEEELAARFDSELIKLQQLPDTDDTDDTEENKKLLEVTHTQLNPTDRTICVYKDNKTYINNLFIYNTEITEDIADNIKLIRTYPNVPYQFIEGSHEQNSAVAKMNIRVAGLLNTKITEYENANENLRGKNGILTTDNYDKIQEIFKQPTINQADIEFLIGIII